MTESASLPATGATERANAQWQADGTQAQLTLSGYITAHTLSGLWTQARANQTTWLNSSPAAKTLTVHMADVSYLDGAGIAFLLDLTHAQQQANGTLTLDHLDPRYTPLMAQYEPIAALFPTPTDSAQETGETFVTKLGQRVANVLDDLRHEVVFVGQSAAALGQAFRKPKLVRWNDFINVATEAGVAALPIVLLVAFLIGVILAFQSAIGLKQFGAETFVANLVSLSIFRELGPLMTAILLAGRSSAAFAAEIGTMTVNNEVDALVTGGIDPIRFLVLPRLLAGLLVAPILSLFSDLIGIFAASLTMLAYKIPFVTFYEAVLTTIHINDVLSGLTKSLLFGLIVAGVGCLRGMETGTGAAAVGLSTTRAVVTSLIFIVLVDGLFAYISYKTGF